MPILCKPKPHLKLASANPNLISSSYIVPAMSVRLVTFNILSPNLAPTHLSASSPACLGSAFRLALTLRQLTPEVKARAIICLQEVAISWSGPLHVFFAQHGYHFIPALYGKRGNGYMGNGLAFPLDTYELLRADIACISDTIAPPPPAPPQSWLATLLRALTAPLAFLAPAPQPTVWDTCSIRFNQMASVLLRPRGSAAAAPFAVSCYHMPCLFMNRSFMTLHCALAAQHAHAFADGARYVLAGDFNIKPKDSQYQLLTEGATAENLPPPQFPGDPWQPRVVPLVSAYAAAGGEPPFTNFSQQPHMREPFIETCVRRLPLYPPALSAF